MLSCFARWRREKLSLRLHKKLTVFAVHMLKKSTLANKLAIQTLKASQPLVVIIRRVLVGQSADHKKNGQKYLHVCAACSAQGKSNTHPPERLLPFKKRLRHCNFAEHKNSPKMCDFNTRVFPTRTVHFNTRHNGQSTNWKHDWLLYDNCPFPEVLRAVGRDLRAVGVIKLKYHFYRMIIPLLVIVLLISRQKNAALFA